MKILLSIILSIPLTLCQLKDNANHTLSDYSNRQEKILSYLINEIYNYLMYLGIVIVITVVIYLVIKFLRSNQDRNEPQSISQNTTPLIQNQAYYLPVNPPYCAICNQLLAVPNMMNQVITSQIVMQCGHSFHYECISNHLKTQNRCPACYLIPQSEPQIQQTVYSEEENQPYLDNYQHENCMAPSSSIQDLNNLK